MTSPRASNIKILVAEANDAIRGRIVKILHWEFEVIGAVSDGIELLGAAVNLAPNAIVTELSLPELRGVDVWSELKGRGKEIPFVFLTSEGDVRAHLGLVSAAYVHKLDIPTSLNSAVRSTIAGQIYLSPRCRKS
jgi:DNA-binding NarL/FixJ family response regulator